MNNAELVRQESVNLIKFIFTIFIAILFLSYFSLTASASESDYRLDELGLSISIPSDLEVITRSNIDEKYNVLSEYGINAKKLSDIMQSKSIYLDAFDNLLSRELLVAMIPNSIHNDYNMYTDSELLQLFKSSYSEYEKQGMVVIKSEIFQHKQAKFIKIYSRTYTDSVNWYILQYITQYDGKLISITMRLKNDWMTTEDKLNQENAFTRKEEFNFLSIITSIIFDTDPVLPPNSNIIAPSFKYKDSKNGTSFTVPEGWKQAEEPINFPFFDVKFTHSEENVIFYGCYDTWSNMSNDEKSGLSRSDIDNSYFDNIKVAELFKVTSGKITKKSYNGIQYYQVLTPVSNSYSVASLYFNNGYMYIFEFIGGYTVDKYLSEYTELLDSVSLPEPVTTEPEPVLSKPDSDKTTNYKSESDSSSKEPDINLNIFICITLTLILYSVPIIIYRYVIKKEPTIPHSGRIIAILWGIGSFILICAFIVSTDDGLIATACTSIILLYINYLILTKGYNDTNNQGSYTFYNAFETADQSKNFYSSVEKPENKVQVVDNQSETALSKNNNIIENSDSDKITCPTCGKKLPDKSKYCSHCGTLLS